MEKTLRLERENKIAVKNGRAPKRQTGSCCMAQLEAAQSGENSDLAAMVQSPLEINIELVDILEPGSFEKEIWEMGNEERLREAPKVKETGVKLYQQGDFEAAAERFSRAVMLLETIAISSHVQDAERERAREFGDAKEALRKQRMNDILAGNNGNIEREGDERKISPANFVYATKLPSYMDQLYTLLQTCRLNYAACKLKLQDYRTVITQTSEIIEKSRVYSIADEDVAANHRAKAYFRRAQAYRLLGSDIERARKDASSARDELVGVYRQIERGGGTPDRASAISTQIKEVSLEIERIEAVKQKQKQAEKGMFSGILL